MPEVNPTEAKRLIDSGAQLIDVRTDVEYEAGHIPGARHVPLADVQRESAALDREKPVILYCRSGNRSGPAADAFAASGWDAHSIEGGLLAWADARLELEPEAGSVAENPNMPPR
jgi:rhodanese-related sulfurtransferase